MNHVIICLLKNRYTDTCNLMLSGRAGELLPQHGCGAALRAALPGDEWSLGPILGTAGDCWNGVWWLPCPSDQLRAWTKCSWGDILGFRKEHWKLMLVDGWCLMFNQFLVPADKVSAWHGLQPFFVYDCLSWVRSCRIRLLDAPATKINVHSFQVQKVGPPLAYQLLQDYLYELEEGSGNTGVFLGELHMAGEYVKWNNNKGWVSREYRSHGSLHAFGSEFLSIGCTSQAGVLEQLEVTSRKHSRTPPTTGHTRSCWWWTSRECPPIMRTVRWCIWPTHRPVTSSGSVLWRFPVGL